MCDVYLMTQGTRAGIASNQMVVTRNDEEISRIPFQTVDTISVYGNVQLTTQLIGHCLNQNVPVSFFFGEGFYTRRTAVSRSDKCGAAATPDRNL